MEGSEMGKQVNWDKVRELRKMIKGQGLNLTEGSLMFGVPLWQLYAIGSEDKNSPELTVAEAKDESITTESPANSNEEDQDSTEKKRENTNIFTESPLPEEVQKLILEYRGKNPKTGFKRIEDHLKSDHLVVVNRKQIRHVLKIHGLLESNDSS